MEERSEQQRGKGNEERSEKRRSDADCAGNRRRSWCVGGEGTSDEGEGDRDRHESEGEGSAAEIRHCVRNARDFSPLNCFENEI